MENFSNLFERILKIIDYKGFKSINDFATKGLSYNSSEKINRLKDANNKPSIDIIIDISNKFEEINLKWLLTGKGEMLGKEERPKPSSSINNEDIMGYKDKIINLQDEISQLKSKIINLQEIIATKKTNFLSQ